MVIATDWQQPPQPSHRTPFNPPVIIPHVFFFCRFASRALRSSLRVLCCSGKPYDDTTFCSLNNFAGVGKFVLRGGAVAHASLRSDSKGWFLSISRELISLYRRKVMNRKTFVHFSRAYFILHFMLRFLKRYMHTFIRIALLTY